MALLQENEEQEITKYRDETLCADDSAVSVPYVLVLSLSWGKSDCLKLVNGGIVCYSFLNTVC